MSAAKASGPPPFEAGEPCPRCLDAYAQGFMRREAIMPLDACSVMNPLAREGWDGATCRDCAAAEGLQQRMDMGFGPARTCISNDRREDLRAPGIRSAAASYGFWLEYPNDLDAHHAWLESVGQGGEY